ncbi:hypothetical protein GIB67_014859 [Kingdonia uniflora]|uniref:EF-hand domain-containing protein n=1 Tax=Kingdonia uniflora TaxID=39325 RepID=A0A7J7MT29_9MAGN|nr:hypothetical protein GIB67_014859 [Kingdonia uniflora]
MGSTSSMLTQYDIEDVQEYCNYLFSQQEIVSLYNRFCQLDRTAKGFISADEFLSVPEFAVNPISQRMLKMIDGLNFKDFVAFLSAFSTKASLEQKIQRAFSILLEFTNLHLFPWDEATAEVLDQWREQRVGWEYLRQAFVTDFDYGLATRRSYQTNLGTQERNVYLFHTPFYTLDCRQAFLNLWSELYLFDLGMNMEELKRDCSILHVETFNSEKKRSGISIRKKDDEKTIYVHWKGDAEMIVSMCSSYQDQTGVINSIDEAEKVIFNQIIQGMAAKSLRCIAFAYGKVVEGEFGYSDPQLLKEEGLVLFGVVGLKDPCRPEVKSAVESCRGAGVKIKMITGDNLFTAISIAIECGILSEEVGFDNGEVVEGAEFRNYTPEERAEKVNIICVMARSSPLEKLLMVQCLKQIGHVVAVTGDGTNDAPALKEADIGLSMDIQGTEVAKESSGIIILDDNFAYVVTVLKWGRCTSKNLSNFSLL